MTQVLQLSHSIYLSHKRYHDAMRIALRMNKQESVEATFNACIDPLEKKQLCYLLARHGLMLDLEDGPCAVEDGDLRDQLREVGGCGYVDI